MKKFRFLFAIMALALVTFSAFTSPKKDTTYYGKDSSGNPVPVLASQEGITWKCVSGTKFCVYTDINLQHPRETTQSYLFELIN